MLGCVGGLIKYVLISLPLKTETAQYAVRNATDITLHDYLGASSRKAIFIKGHVDGGFPHLEGGSRP